VNVGHSSGHCATLKSAVLCLNGGDTWRMTLKIDYIISLYYAEENQLYAAGADLSSVILRSVSRRVQLSG